MMTSKPIILSLLAIFLIAFLAGCVSEPQNSLDSKAPTNESIIATDLENTSLTNNTLVDSNDVEFEKNSISSEPAVNINDDLPTPIDGFNIPMKAPPSFILE